MFKNLISIVVISLILTANFVNAEVGKNDVTYAQGAKNMVLPSPDVCPSSDVLAQNKDWIEHTGLWSKNMVSFLANHLSLPLSPNKPTISVSLVPVDVDRGMGITQSSEIVWTVRRTGQTNFRGKSSNCHVIGSVAYYVEASNKDGWPPKVSFIKEPEYEKQWLQNGTIGLIELRWYDPVEMKRNRWFNSRLARYLQWVKGGRYSAISLPRVINSLD